MSLIAIKRLFIKSQLLHIPAAQPRNLSCVNTSDQFKLSSPDLSLQAVAQLRQAAGGQEHHPRRAGAGPRPGQTHNRVTIFPAVET